MSNSPPVIPIWDNTFDVEEDKNVYRAPSLSEVSFGPSVPPPMEIFNLSTADEDEGARLNKQPLLSVWDANMPLPEISARRITSNNNNKKLVVFEAKVEDINKIETPHNHAKVKVVKANIDGDSLGHLHYGIQGLFRDAGRLKKDYKNIKSQLQRLFNFKGET